MSHDFKITELQPSTLGSEEEVDEECEYEEEYEEGSLGTTVVLPPRDYYDTSTTRTTSHLSSRDRDKATRTFTPTGTGTRIKLQKQSAEDPLSSSSMATTLSSSPSLTTSTSTAYNPSPFHHSMSSHSKIPHHSHSNSSSSTSTTISSHFPIQKKHEDDYYEEEVPTPHGQSHHGTTTANIITKPTAASSSTANSTLNYASSWFPNHPQHHHQHNHHQHHRNSSSTQYRPADTQNQPNMKQYTMNPESGGISTTLASSSSSTSLVSKFTLFASKAASSLQDVMQNATHRGTGPNITFHNASSSTATFTMSHNHQSHHLHSNTVNSTSVPFQNHHHHHPILNSSSSSSSLPASFVPSSTTLSPPELDNSKKTAVLASALGTSNLLPGERIIMFLSHLLYVRDSSTPHTGIGYIPSWKYDTSVNLTGGKTFDSGETLIPNRKDNRIVWCCAMTLYRLILFQYFESDFSDVGTDDELIPSRQNQISSSSHSNGGDSNHSTNNNPDHLQEQELQEEKSQESFSGASHNPDTMQVSTNTKAEVTKCNSISRQNKGRHKHVVVQIPLASIERLERMVIDNSVLSLANNNYLHSNINNNSNNNISNTSATLHGSPLPTTNHLLSSMDSYSSTALFNTSNNMSNGSFLCLIIHGKDNGRFIRFAAPSHVDTMRAYEALNTYAFPGRRNLGYLFAFESRREEVMSNVQQVASLSLGDGGNSADGRANSYSTSTKIQTRATTKWFDPIVEFNRMGILDGVKSLQEKDDQCAPSPWRLYLSANANYELCGSYPSIIIGPSSVNDENSDGLKLLHKIASFRSEGRLPALTWSSRYDGASIWRSSQPKVGLQGNRNAADEMYLKIIAESAFQMKFLMDKAMKKNYDERKRPTLLYLKMLTGGMYDSELLLENGSNSSCSMKIMDLRPKSSAMANRTAGYGYENSSNYPNTSITFHGIGNIHAVRESYNKISSLCNNPATNDLNWSQLVEETKWLQHLRLILSASWQVAFHVHYNRLPVLVHCSHGWDRTSQVVSLAQILLDPYYRTRAGFCCLVEKDFMSFGHPFHTRCGHGEGKPDRGGNGSGVGGNAINYDAGPGAGASDEGQVAPIFIQFLDCVHQLVKLNPDDFEFNSAYLLLLSEHVYSCRFGTLLCDTERERETVASIRQRTFCLWEYLNSDPGLVNQSFKNPTEGESIRDSSETMEWSGALLMPLPSLLRNVSLWTDRFCMHGPKATFWNPRSDFPSSSITSLFINSLADFDDVS